MLRVEYDLLSVMGTSVCMATELRVCGGLRRVKSNRLIT